MCKKGVKWYFCSLDLVFVQVCFMLLMADSTLDLLVGLVFSFSLKCVQFLEEELSLSHLHMLSHTCFYPGGLPCCFFPLDIIIWFAAASAPYFGSCGSAVFACGCFPGVVQAWLPQPAAWCAAFPSAPLTCSSVSQGSLR